MSSLADPATANSVRPRFRTPPWHDHHPARRQLEQRLAPDHLARTIDAAVPRLDLSDLRASYGRTGSQAHAPELLLRVVLFEMRRGRHHPSQWYHDAGEYEPVRWLLRGSVVSRSCWYAFRDRIAPLLLDLNAQVLAWARDAGLTPARRAAGDGTLVAANASRHKLLNQATLTRHLEQVSAALADDQRQQAAADVAPPSPVAPPLPTLPAASRLALPLVPATPATPAAPPAWLAATVRGRLQQQRRLQRAQERLQQLHARNQRKWASKRKAAETIVVSPSDAEAVVGRDKEKVFRPLYNVQIFDDLDSPLILGYAVLAQQNDSGVLGFMLQRVEQQVGHRLEEVLTDASYAGGADLAAAQRAGVTVYAPVPGDGVKEPKQIPKREFSWLAAQQVYVCPQGQRLELEESWREKRAEGSVQVWRYRCPPQHCLRCPVQARCTTTPTKGRAVQRLEHEELLEALRARMATAAAKALYRLRGQNVELANADWKEHRKLRRFSGRGLARVTAEVGLLVLVHNLVALATAEKKSRAEPAQEAAANASRNST